MQRFKDLMSEEVEGVTDEGQEPCKELHGKLQNVKQQVKDLINKVYNEA